MASPRREFRLMETMVGYPDIYFEPDYARLYETEDIRAVEYRFECEYGVITNLFMKRRIDVSLYDGKEYYDIITPYGYGGPVIHSVTDKERLIAAFMSDFQVYADRERIVDEFVRFIRLLGTALISRTHTVPSLTGKQSGQT